MNATLKSLLLASCLLLTGQAVAQPVSIASINYNGSGCLFSSGLTAQLQNNDTAGLPRRLNVRFPNYTVRQGGDPSLSSQRKNCTITLSIQMPQRWQFSIASVRYFGTAALPAGVSGQQRTDYVWPFASNTATLQDVLPGPYRARFDRQDKLQFQELAWSPCGVNAPLTIRTQIVLSGPMNIPASLRVARHVYGLVWRRCPQ